MHSTVLVGMTCIQKEELYEKIFQSMAFLLKQVSG